MITAVADSFQVAVARFNAGEEVRTVAGLTRTLGEPRVSIGAVAGSAPAARITIAWELTWYQWIVAAGEEEGPIVELGKGTEIAELDAAARQWNAQWRS